MARAVGNEGDEVHVGALGTAEEAVDGGDEDLDEVDVLPLVETADVVGLSDFTFVENHVDGPGVVDHIQPVADIFALAVNWKGFAMADVVDEEGYQLFGELIRTVVVRTVGDDGRKSESIVEGADEVVARGLCCAVRAMGLIFQILGEELFAVGEMMLPGRCLGGEGRLDALGMSQLQGSVNFIGGDMVESLALEVAFPAGLCGLEEGEGSHHVGLCKGERVLDGAVHVAFGGEVDDAVDLLFAHQCEDAVEVADVHLDEAVVGLVFDVLEVGEVAGIGKFIDVDNPVLGIFLDKQADDVASDEACASGNDDAA